MDLDVMRSGYTSKGFETIKGRLIISSGNTIELIMVWSIMKKASYKEIGEFDKETPEYIITLAREREFTLVKLWNE